MELITLYAIPFSITLYFATSFGRGWKYLTLILWSYFLFSFIGVIFSWIFWHVELIHFLFYFQILILVGILYLFTVTTSLAFKGDINTKIFSSGFLILTLFTIINILGALGIIYTVKSTVSYGVFAFVLFLGAIIVRDFIQTHRTLQLYSVSLEEKTWLWPPRKIN